MNTAKKLKAEEKVEFTKEQIEKRSLEKVLGRFQSKTVLEKYCDNGDLGILRDVSPNDLLSAGKRLYRDWYLSGLPELKASQYDKPIVDSSVSSYCPTSKEDAFDRYEKAMKSVSSHFREIVRIVCVEDKPIVANDNNSAYRKSIDIGSQKKDLCRGLFELVCHYRGR
ncbi:MAG: hypothetical protein ACK5N8_06735 [Alphaproteobacteria bacterium]